MHIAVFWASPSCPCWELGTESQWTDWILDSFFSRANIRIRYFSGCYLEVVCFEQWCTQGKHELKHICHNLVTASFMQAGLSMETAVISTWMRYIKSFLVLQITGVLVLGNASSSQGTLDVAGDTSH